MINFCGLYFNFAWNFIIAILTQVLLAVVRSLGHSGRTELIAANCAQNVVALCLILLLCHALITKAGNQYVKVEIQCETLEQLHDDLEEGVIIYDKASDDVFFNNKVAIRLIGLKET